MASLERVMFALSLVAWGCESSSDGDELPLGMGGSGTGAANSAGGDAGEVGERAGTSAGGTANLAGGAGQRGGRGGTGTIVGMAGELNCTDGEAGKRTLYCGPIVTDMYDVEHLAVCSNLDCVSDCTSSAIVRGELVGCEVRCPSEAPVHASDCAQRAAYPAEYECGPGLYANHSVQASYQDCFSWEVGSCGCSEVPESCPVSDDDRWVCAANEMAYRSACEAARARTGLPSRAGVECAAPRDDLFQCGGYFCVRDIEVCKIEVGPNDHDDDSYWCAPSGGAGGESGAGAGGA